MNDAVWTFRTFEEPSLRYGGAGGVVTTQGGWDVRRDQNFALLMDCKCLQTGDVLRSVDTAWGDLSVTVSEDYGLLYEGIRYESPDDVAETASGGEIEDGWTSGSLTLPTARRLSRSA